MAFKVLLRAEACRNNEPNAMVRQDGIALNQLLRHFGLPSCGQGGESRDKQVFAAIDEVPLPGAIEASRRGVQAWRAGAACGLAFIGGARESANSCRVRRFCNGGAKSPENSPPLSERRHLRRLREDLAPEFCPDAERNGGAWQHLACWPTRTAKRLPRSIFEGFCRLIRKTSALSDIK